MESSITNVYANTALKEPIKFKKGYGNAFLIEHNGKKMLFDTGDSGKKLIYNLNLLDISPGSIDKVILSHGHFDHTKGIPLLAGSREDSNPLKIFCNPAARENKGTGTPEEFTDGAGFPELSDELKDRIEFIDLHGFTKIETNLYAITDIEERPEKDGCAALVHERNGRWEPDPVIDDLSLILQSKDGLILICGCCHAGLLNTCNELSKHIDGEITTVIGGTHMMGFSTSEVDHVATILEEKYGSPALYLNHCSGKSAIARFAEKFGKEKVKPFPAGSSLKFECK
ncbi:MAG: MBL fold metallo-hydrolase [Promethearchaeota archaeon]